MKKNIYLLLFFLISISIYAIEAKMEKLITDRYPVINPVMNITEDKMSIKDLSPENLEVWVKTKVPFSAENRQLPINVILIMDKSGSLKDDIKHLKGAADHFLEVLKPQDKVALVAFDKKTYFLQDFTKDRELIKKSYMDLEARGATRLYDTIVESVKKYSTKDSYTTCVVFTDGKDERYEGSPTLSESTPEDVVSVCTEKEVPLHIIGYGDSVDKEIIEFITNKTHGNSYFTPKGKEFRRIYTNIANSFNNLLNITYTSPFKDWYKGKRYVEVKVKKDKDEASDEKNYYRKEAEHIVEPTSNKEKVISLMEKIPRITIVATDRENRLIDGQFKVLVNGKVADSGNIVKGTAGFDLKDYFFDENFKRTPDNYEKLHKKTVLFTPELKLRVFTTEAGNQFVPMKIKLISLDGKREYSFTTTYDGIGNELVTQDIIEGVYSLRITNNNKIILKDVINIEKNYRLTRNYKFGRITFKADNSLFGDRENTSLLIDVYDNHSKYYLFRDEPLYKITGGQSFVFLPPGRYRITLKNSDSRAKYLKGDVEFECIILGGENIRTNLKYEDIAQY